MAAPQNARQQNSWHLAPSHEADSEAFKDILTLPDNIFSGRILWGSAGELEQDCPPLCFRLLCCSTMAKHLETQQHDWGCREILGLRRRDKHKFKKVFSVPAGRLSRFLSLRSLSNAPPPFQANTNKDATAGTQHLSRPVPKQLRFLADFNACFVSQHAIAAVASRYRPLSVPILSTPPHRALQG